MEIWQLDPAVYAGRKFTARYRTKGYYDICAAEDRLPAPLRPARSADGEVL